MKVTDSAVHVAAAVDRLAGEVAAVEAHLRPERVVVDVHQWRKAARLPALVWAVPGFADLWQQEVPDDAIVPAGDWASWVFCRCGEPVLVELGAVTYCPADCGVWLLRLESGSVRVKVWPREEASVAA